MDTTAFAERIMEISPRLVKAIASYESNDLARGKITLPQFWALHSLAQGRCKMKSLAQQLGTSPAAATGLTNRLVSQGLVVREHDHKDRRIVWIGLSSRGRESIGRIRKQRIRAIIALFCGLPEDERDDYLRILEKVVKNAGISAVTT